MKPRSPSARVWSDEYWTDSAGRLTANRPFVRPRATAYTQLRAVRWIASTSFEPIVTGIRAIDTITPCGTGQRMGIFGGSGVGKSTLLGAMARHNSADVTVIALIGERNREVRAFLDHELGPEGSQRSVVVCSTSDRPAPLRVRACFVALAIAEYFRDQGANVLLIMDSVTRLAMAQREIGLAAGEPPSQKGYTPSVFNLLPRVLERAGNFQKGSITGFFTVLVEGDDFNEPICDAVRAILDGHIILSRRLAAAGHYPAIDVRNSVSRLCTQLSSPEHLASARKMREALTVYEESKDLIELGAYVAGTNPQLDTVIRMQPEIAAFLKQDTSVDAPLEEEPGDDQLDQRETLTKMPAFRFRLDRVLEWYREQSKIEEGRLANCVAAVNAVLAGIARLEAERQSIDQELIGRSSIAAGELVALGRYRLRAAQRAATLEQDRLRRQSALVQQRTKVQAAQRRLRLIEKLRERRFSEHIRAEERDLECLASESFLAKWVAGAK